MEWTHTMMLDLQGHMNRMIIINHSLLSQTAVELWQMKRAVIRHIALAGNKGKEDHSL